MPSPPVFYYHSVAPETDPSWILHFLTYKLDYFEEQMAFLASKNVEAVFFNEWYRIRMGDAAVSGNKICLSFDDGYLDNWVYAFPIAKKYKLRFTIFVSPECVDPRNIVRPNLEEVWNKTCNQSDLQSLGYASWPELKIMQESGYVDIQSHGMTHAKYITSPKVSGFYYGNYLGLHPYLNKHPYKRPFYMTQPDSSHLLPFGSPLFEENSAIVTKKRKPHAGLLKNIEKLAGEFNLENASERPDFEKKAWEIIVDFKSSQSLISDIESDDAYFARLNYEVKKSKDIIEEKLKKPVHFLCWPFGENTVRSHALARNLGYLATTSGKLISEEHKRDRIPRSGADFNNNRWLSKKKLQYKLASHYKIQPYYLITQAYNLVRQYLPKT